MRWNLGAFAIALSPILAGTLGSLAAGLLTAAGAVPMLFLRRPSPRGEHVLLGFAAGVMLAASFFSLIVPGIDVLIERGASRALAAATMAGAVLIGAAAIGLINRRVQLDVHAVGPASAAIAVTRRLWLFVFAITLHNFPEGMAVGVSFGGDDLRQGIPTALGIGLQNIPEGLAVAVSLVALGYGRGLAFSGALASGLVEPVGGAFGASVVAMLPDLLPWGLGLAAGAMIYVVTAEMIPGTKKDADGDRATIGLMIGLVGMMFLDVALG